LSADERLRGRVLVARGTRCRVDTARGRLDCVIRGSLKKGKAAAVNPVAAGDWVEVTLEPDGSGVIEAVEPRRTKFSRPAPGRLHLEQVIVANATRLIVVQAAREPTGKVTSIDRYLVAAEVGNLRPVLCMNKMDLDRRGQAAGIVDLYRGLGFEVHATVATMGDGVEGLAGTLTGEVSVLVGPSGAGKSTLLNRIQPGLGLRVRDVSRKWSKGRHTTSEAALFSLDVGGWVADTPGLRELGLWGVEREELAHYYHEFVPFVDECRFTECSHSHEPDCGVATAVEQGRISRDRYTSYLRILKSIAGSD